MSEHGLQVGQVWVGKNYWNALETVRCVVRLSREAGEDEFGDQPGSSVLVVHHVPLACLLDTCRDFFEIDRERAWFPIDESGFVTDHALVGHISVDKLPSASFLESYKDVEVVDR